MASSLVTLRLTTSQRIVKLGNGISETNYRRLSLPSRQLQVTSNAIKFKKGSRKASRVQAEQESGALLEKENNINPTLVGEDAAVFQVSEQKLSSWIKFTAVLIVVLGILYVIWLSPDTGFGRSYLDFIASFSDSLEVCYSL